MTLVKNDIEISNQAEERNAREAKRIEASDFHSGEAGLSSVASTNNFEGLNENDWQVEKCGNDFSIKTVDRQVAGINTSRLSVLRT